MSIPDMRDERGNGMRKEEPTETSTYVQAQGGRSSRDLETRLAVLYSYNTVLECTVHGYCCPFSSARHHGWAEWVWYR
jgi:hypothetical protein